MDEFDEVLKLEERFYKEGFEEGRRENLQHNYIEGKQFGLQVGFQRFILIGQMLGICNVLTARYSTNAALMKSVESVRKLIESIKFDNDAENVENYEVTVVKLKNKFRIILLALQRQLKGKKRTEVMNYDKVEEITRIIAGEVIGFNEDEDTTKQFLAQDKKTEW
ncbi:hypothetical protein TPHA_0B04350 [Tetrapisispora phaffii CBS 4417]|uniref:Essential protein Yae1 N-terminal domain-containing protein n=1 Tax=Tetrapisispora phaffii (strain ATCC 24235 / CBS 4417 / NBRC 1672 / NRRL Y-8282 / UCD 70-5) TaxID=1071381 RepID=G8BQ23_TETPH|nr:hypothetical protein TPHA_0B04350 [Tetrapisispora phaffii CBS 4417]CCE62104.1 hypothetical protein TPHA_0B04350 [Tetrapisispora phaffii CBS 4417]